MVAVWVVVAFAGAAAVVVVVVVVPYVSMENLVIEIAKYEH